MATVARTPDAELLLRLRTRDREAWEELYAEYQPRLRAFGYRLAGNVHDADDLVQDTVLKAWTNREQFQSGSNLKAWLFTILRNCYYSELRHRKFEIEDPDGICASQMAIAPDHDAKLHLRDLSRALQHLPVVALPLAAGWATATWVALRLRPSESVDPRQSCSGRRPAQPIAWPASRATRKVPRGGANSAGSTGVSSRPP